ncbi:MAG TPA: hypothetical protein VIE67_09405 [Rudaea sp.]
MQNHSVHFDPLARRAAARRTALIMACVALTIFVLFFVEALRH